MDSDEHIKALLDKASATKDSLEAIVYFEEVLRINPLHADALTRIAATYALLGRNRECLGFAQRATFIDSAATGAWALQEHALLGLGIRDKGANLDLCNEQIAWCDNYSTQHPTVPYGWHLKAFTLTCLDRHDDALVILARVCELAPAFADAFHLRGCILFDLGRKQEAREALTKAHELGHRKAEDALKHVADSLQPSAMHQEAYQAIVQTCRRSQEMMNVDIEKIGLNWNSLVGDVSQHLELWKTHDARSPEPARLNGADFRRLIFRNHRFRNHGFVNCNFSGSRWFLAGIQDSDCSGSNFTGITTMLFDLQNVNCTGCNFTKAELWFGFNIDQTNFLGADFSGATLRLSEHFHKSKAAPNFAGAVMTGCTFINDSRHERGAFRKWFTESQRAVMSVGQGKARSGCFIATAACGKESPEVAILREYRDRILLATPMGRAFVHCYCHTSPLIARGIERSRWLRAAVRAAVVIPAAELARHRLQHKGIF
jgi:hypothetical protein